MEFTNFYNNIKTEPVGAPQHYGPPVSVQHDKQKVNPFMQWAVASIQGFYFSGPQAGGTSVPQQPPVTESSGQPQLQHQPNPPSHPPPCSTPGQVRTEQARPVTISASTAQETGRQVVAMQGPNYTMHTMVPLEHQQHHQSTDLVVGNHQQNHAEPLGGPANDTAFPGAPLRHNYPVMGGGQQGVHHQDLSKQHVLKQEHNNHHINKKIYTEENGQVVAYNGSAEQMARHNRGEKVDRVYDCSDCDKAFTREEHLKRHAKSHTDEPVHTCEVIGCNKSYTRKERLTRHYKVAHLGQEPERPFWCSECGKDFQRKEHLTRHTRNIHGPGGSMESQEYKITPQQQQNPIHQARPLVSTTTNHQTGQQQQQPQPQQTVVGGAQGGSLRCTYEGCPKTYSRREHLNRHIKLHMGIEPDRPYYCHDCGKTFTRKEHLLRHRRSHTGETPYPCPGTCVTGPECTKQFARKEHLKRHLRAHTGEHPYPCSECGRTFGRRERLLKHLKSHGVGVQIQPKREFKKEPDFVQDTGHGVFGDQTNQLLRMIAQKGPISPDQLTSAPPVPVAHDPLQSRHHVPLNGITSAETFFSNPDVARALSNPEIVAAFSNPDVVKAFALTPPKRAPGSQTPPSSQGPPQPEVANTSARGPDIANSPAVPAELSKLPSGFSIFPVVAPASQTSQTSTLPNGPDQPSQVQTQANSYYQAGQSYVASVPGHPRELTTIPMSWAGWPMSGMQAGAAMNMVNIRSPAKLEPGTETKHWEPATAYFRSPFS